MKEYAFIEWIDRYLDYIRWRESELKLNQIIQEMEKRKADLEKLITDQISEVRNHKCEVTTIINELSDYLGFEALEGARE